METFMGGAMVVEATLLSFLLALWMTWMGLRGLFRLIPLTSSPIPTLNAQQRQVAASRQQHPRRREAA